MNILYFAPIRIYPTGHGNIAKVIRHIERLRTNGHKVHYVYFDEQGLSQFELFYAQNFVDTLDVIKWNNAQRKRINGYYEFDSWYQVGLGEKIANLCDIYKIDVVICTYVMYSKLLDFVPYNILKIIDTHDKMTDRHLSLIKNNIPDEFFSCTRADEARYLNRADIVWGIRDEETQYFNSIMENNKAITVSHFDEPNFLEKSIEKLKKVGFLASDNNVNAKMVIDFSDEILKNDEFLKTDIEIIIGGNVKKILEQNKEFMDKIQNSPIKLVGKFEKLEDFYKTVDAVIIPIMFGTGINIKMIEAMSFGIPVISTKCGIKGVNSNSKYHSADSMEELIDRIVELYNNPQDISQLTDLSKTLFMEFYNKNAKNFDECITKSYLPKKNAKVLILPPDCYCFGSFGDQAMISSLLSQLKKKYTDEEISFFSLISASWDKNFENDYGYSYYYNSAYADETWADTLQRFRAAVKNVDYFLVIGADILDGSCTDWQAIKYLSLINEAAGMGKKSIALAFSFNNKANDAIKQMIANCNHPNITLCPRDEISYERLEEYGCKNLVQTADMAFLFDETKYKASVFANNLKNQLEEYKKQGRKIVALHLTAKAEKADDFIDKVIKSLENHKDAIFVAFPQDYRIIPGYLCPDEIMCNKICEKMNSLGFETINAYHLQNEIDVKSAIGLCDLLITCRMHIAIAAFSKNVPVISFVYQGKFEGLYNFYDFKQNLMFEKDNFEIDKLKEAVSYILNNDFSKMIKEKNKNVFELAKKNFEFLRKME